MVGGEDVDGHDRLQAETAHDVQMLEHVGGAGAHVVGALVQHPVGQLLAAGEMVPARVDLESAHGDDEDRGLGSHARRRALEVDEPFQAHVGAESRFGEHVARFAGPPVAGRRPTGEAASRDEVGQDGGTAGGNVAERTGVDQSGHPLTGAQEVGS